MKTEALVNAAVVVLSICALTVTGLAVRREFFTSGPSISQGQPANVPDWRSYAAEGRRDGPVNAPVTIVEFSDYQCPFCRRTFARLDSLRKAEPTRVAIVHRHFPLPGHAQALSAALAAECAADQGVFGAYQATLYANQDSLSPASWSPLAKAAGVGDLPRFEACVRDSTFKDNVYRDLAAGHRLEVIATPSLLINHLRVQGEVPGDALAKLLDSAERSARP